MNSQQRDLDMLCDDQEFMFVAAGELIPTSIWDKDKGKLAGLLDESVFDEVCDYYEREAKDMANVIRAYSWSREKKRDHVYQVCNDLYERNESIIKLINEQLNAQKTWYRRMFGV